MCLYVYLGSPKPLPAIPWKKLDPDFHVSPASKRARRAVSDALDDEYVYEVGSREGCGCAFIDEHWDWNGDSEETRLIQESRSKLLGYLTEIEGSTEGVVRLLLAWSGDERKQPESRVASLQQFAEMDFQDSSDRPLLINLVRDGGY